MPLTQNRQLHAKQPHLRLASGGGGWTPATSVLASVPSLDLPPAVTPPAPDEMLVLFEVSQIAVLSGVLAFETLQQAADLILGDTYCFRDSHPCAQGHALGTTHLMLNACPRVGSRKLAMDRHQDLVLMSHTGRVVNVIMVTLEHSPDRLLLGVSADMNLTVEYDLIARKLHL